MREDAEPPRRAIAFPLYASLDSPRRVRRQQKYPSESSVALSFDGQRLRAHAILVAVAFWLNGAAASGAVLPFSVVIPPGEWKATTVHQDVGAGIAFELILTHVGVPDGLIVVSSPRSVDQPESLHGFAERLKDSFNGFHSDDAVEKEANEFGYSGRKLRFKLAQKKDAFDCELFVFAVEHTLWGVLYAKSPNTPATAAEAFRLLRRDDPVSTKTVAMEPFRVKDVPVSDFPISFEIARNSGSDHLKSIVVTEVPPGSKTERVGVKVGDAIVAINDRKTTDFAVGVGKDSELGRIFLNRNTGEEVELEIQPADGSKLIRVTLRAGTAMDRLFR